KFRVLKYFSRQRLPECIQCGPVSPIPQELLPLNPDEITVGVPGGDITADGVRLLYKTNLTIDFSTGSVPATAPVDEWADLSSRGLSVGHQYVSRPSRFVVFLVLNSPASGRIASTQGVSLVDGDDSLRPLAHGLHKTRVMDEAGISNLTDLQTYATRVH